MRSILLSVLLVCAFAGAHAEGNYDPFSSKNPQERAHAARMRDAIEKGDWAQAQTFATTPSLQRLYAQAKREYRPVAPVSPAEAASKDSIASPRVERPSGR